MNVAERLTELLEPVHYGMTDKEIDELELPKLYCKWYGLPLIVAEWRNGLISDGRMLHELFGTKE